MNISQFILFKKKKKKGMLWIQGETSFAAVKLGI